MKYLIGFIWFFCSYIVTVLVLTLAGKPRMADFHLFLCGLVGGTVGLSFYLALLL